MTAPRVARAPGRTGPGGFRRRWAAALPLAAPVLERLGRLDGLLVNQVVRVDYRRWVDGRLVLVGDAAHAMGPNLGQGANSAIVDAAVLAANRLARLSRVSHPVLRWGRDVALRRLGRLATGPSRQHRVQQEDPVWLHATAQALQPQQRPPTLTD